MLNPDDKAHLEWLKLQQAGTETVRAYLDRRIADLTKKLQDDIQETEEEVKTSNL